MQDPQTKPQGFANPRGAEFQKIENRKEQTKMSFETWKRTNEKIEKKVVDGYRKIEDGVVGGFEKVSDGFVERLFAREGESVGQAKERLARQAAAQRGADPAGKKPGDAL